MCVKCGVRFATDADPEVGKRDWLTALLLSLFLGVFGVHRFYVGLTGTGIAQLLTLGGCGIWSFIDFIQIATGNFRDADGRKLLKR